MRIFGQNKIQMILGLLKVQMVYQRTQQIEAIKKSTDIEIE